MSLSVPARLRQTAVVIRSSYWFLPSMLASLGFFGGLALVYVDALLGVAWLGDLEWFYGSRPAGARAMLSTIAGSTITVAGVVFSITLAAVTYASGQFGPRLLGNFMQDRGNQTTLGIFIGTYLYCLVVLRTIHGAGEDGAGAAGEVVEAFVPHLAMFGALSLAVISTGVLIYFVHHVTAGIHINNVVADVGRRLIRAIRADCADSGDPIAASVIETTEREAATHIHAPTSGYITCIDYSRLAALGCRLDVTMRLVRRAGDFVAEGQPWVTLHRPGPLDADAVQACNDALALAPRRTPQQDLRFDIDELVEIAIRALSPGINDPFTAMNCMDWLGAALAEMDRQAPPRQWQADVDGMSRVDLCPPGFDDYLALAFGQMLHYAAADPLAYAHATTSLGHLAAQLGNPAHRRSVEDMAARLRNLGPTSAI